MILVYIRYRRFLRNSAIIGSMRTPTITPAYGYLRVSGKGQLAGDGFPRQKAAIEKYAQTHGIQIAEWFQEKAVPGATEWENRPAWSAMVQTLNGVRTILVEKVDRLARDLGVQEWIMRDLKTRGVTLLSATEEDLDSDPTRVLFRQIMGAISQYDKTMLVLKLRGARQRKRKSGQRCEGRLPYGLRPGESAIVQRIRELRAQKVTFMGIAEQFKNEGIRTRYEKDWTASYVQKALKHNSRPAYLVSGGSR